MRYDGGDQDYLNMYDMNDCMFKDIGRMVEDGSFDLLNEVHETQYCSICGIKKKRKMRHCPNVASGHAGQPLHT